jgi:hypothetical protein
MKPDVRHDMLGTLFGKAREYEPDISRVEAGFETRVMARIRSERGSHTMLFDWAWRLLPIFTALVVAMGIWSYSTLPPAPMDLQAAVSAEYDHDMSFNLFNGDQS